MSSKLNQPFSSKCIARYGITCDKPATHWYLHNNDICSYCDEHNYICGEDLNKVQTKEENDGLLE